MIMGAHVRPTLMSPSTLLDRIRELEAALEATETRAARAENIVARCDLLNEELCFQIKRLEAELRAGAMEVKRLRDHAENVLTENGILRARVKEVRQGIRERAGQRPSLVESTCQLSTLSAKSAEG
jgi:chromosome segregation ATPase